jgi:asparagine synthase (glutamine-hydrolysing)
MCGITGFISKQGNSSKDLYNLNSIIQHRGPDDEGYLIIKNDNELVSLIGPDTPKNFNLPCNSINDNLITNINIGLAHRRLSILDLSKHGHQPMSYLDNRYWIVYNGEIYNFIELRVELIKAGYTFISNSDTEVILASYVHWGLECVHKFNGMWAFVIYDTKKKLSFISRDRFGVKPLYYWISPNNTFCFSSEIKSFTVFPNWKSNLNHQMAYDFLVWGIMDHTDETMFEGVYQLKPGSYAIIDEKTIFEHKKRISLKQWYTLSPKKYNGSFEDAKNIFKNLFENSLNLIIRSDVPIGSCLSGGLDSSSIVCATNSILKNNFKDFTQKTFSACSEFEHINEKKWIDEVVNKTNVDSYIVYPNVVDLLSNLNELIWHQDEPFGTTSIFAQWKVFQLASENNVKVMLDGQGADEQLAGYNGFFNTLNASFIKKMKFTSFLKSIYHLKLIHGTSYLSSILEMFKQLMPENFKQPFRTLLAKTESKPTWYKSKHKIRYTNPFISGSTEVQEMSVNQLTSSNLQMLLHWEDRDSMAFSIESRVPFLDYRIVEFVLSLPDDYKIKNGITKLILRESMSNIIPDKIRDRYNKIGFATPEEIWLKDLGKKEFKDRYSKTIQFSDQLFDSSLTNRLDEILDGKKPFSFLPWRVICFGEWVKLFNVNI